MKCYHCVTASQAGTESDCWQRGKGQVARTQTAKEGPGTRQLRYVELGPETGLRACSDRLL